MTDQDFQTNCCTVYGDKQCFFRYDAFITNLQNLVGADQANAMKAKIKAELADAMKFYSRPTNADNVRYVVLAFRPRDEANRLTALYTVTAVEPIYADLLAKNDGEFFTPDYSRDPSFHMFCLGFEGLPLSA